MPARDTAKLKLDGKWGDDDAAEVCFQDGSGPVFVIHGFANGKHESVSEAGAPAAAAQRLGAAVAFAAKLGNGRWTGEWRIPLAAAGITCHPGLALHFNLGVRRSETEEWIQWCGSGATWNLHKAGTAVFG